MSPRLHYFKESTSLSMHGACVLTGLHLCVFLVWTAFNLSQQQNLQWYNFVIFPFNLWHMLKYCASVFKLKVLYVFFILPLRLFCLPFFFFLLTPQSLLTVCYWSGSWSLNWSMRSVTCLRYPTWAISLNNVFINWLIITVKLISRIYICVLPTIDL